MLTPLGGAVPNQKTHPALLRMWHKRQWGYRAMGYRVEAQRAFSEISSG
jgi:hypothetical protein